MKRTTKPPQPPHIADPGRPVPTPLPHNISPFKLPAVPAPPSSKRVNTRPPALPTGSGSAAAIAAATSWPPVVPIGERSPPQDDSDARPPAPTLPFVPTPLVDWDPTPPEGHQQPYPPPPPPPPTEARGNQMWSGLAGDSHAPVGPPTPQANLQAAVSAPPPPQSQRDPGRLSSGSLRSHAPAPVSSGSYPAAPPPSSGNPGPPMHGIIEVPRPAPAPPPGDDGDHLPLGYVVASAFFLAIALVGFGLYLAFEVISL